MSLITAMAPSDKKAAQRLLPNAANTGPSSVSAITGGHRFVRAWRSGKRRAKASISEVS